MTLDNLRTMTDGEELARLSRSIVPEPTDTRAVLHQHLFTCHTIRDNGIGHIANGRW